MTNVEIWIERWQDGDERAAKALYEHHRERLFRLAYGILGNAQDAEEAAQDALTYALVNIHKYAAGRAAFSTWLHTITVSRCRDRLRRKRLPRLSLTTWLQWGRELIDGAPDPESRAIRAEDRGAVLEAVHSLSPEQREAVMLRYWAGHTYREIADIMDCPLPTAQSRVRLAFKRLRSKLAAKNVAGEVEGLNV